MTSDARIDSIKNTLIIQGYVETTGGRARMTEEGYEAFIILMPLVPTSALLAAVAMALKLEAEGGEESK